MSIEKLDRINNWLWPLIYRTTSAGSDTKPPVPQPLLKGPLAALLEWQSMAEGAYSPNTLRAQKAGSAHPSVAVQSTPEAQSPTKDMQEEDENAEYRQSIAAQQLIDQKKILDFESERARACVAELDAVKAQLQHESAKLKVS